MSAANPETRAALDEKRIEELRVHQAADRAISYAADVRYFEAEAEIQLLQGDVPSADFYALIAGRYRDPPTATQEQIEAALKRCRERDAERDRLLAESATAKGAP
jgi:hypothetical protein